MKRIAFLIAIGMALAASAATPVPAVDLANVDLQDIDESGKRIEMSYVDGLLRAWANFGFIIVIE